MATKQVHVGDQVSWKWSGARPQGEVAEVKDQGNLSIMSNKGNEITRNGEPEDPAVHVARDGNDVVKRAHELEVESPAKSKTNGHHGNASKGKEPKKSDDAENKEDVTALGAPSVVDNVAEERDVPKEDIEPSAPGDSDKTQEPDQGADDTPAALSATTVSQAGDKRAHEEENEEAAAAVDSEKPGKASEDSSDVDMASEQDESSSPDQGKKAAPKAGKKQEPAAKKQKTKDKDNKASSEKKTRGRKKSSGKAENKPAPTADGKPRRSSRFTS